MTYFPLSKCQGRSTSASSSGSTSQHPSLGASIGVILGLRTPLWKWRNYEPQHNQQRDQVCPDVNPSLKLERLLLLSIVVCGVFPVAMVAVVFSAVNGVDLFLLFMSLLTVLLVVVLVIVAGVVGGGIIVVVAAVVVITVGSGAVWWLVLLLLLLLSL